MKKNKVVYDEKGKEIYRENSKGKIIDKRVKGERK